MLDRHSGAKREGARGQAGSKPKEGRLGAVLSSQGEGALCWIGTAAPSGKALEAKQAASAKRGEAGCSTQLPG